MTEYQKLLEQRKQLEAKIALARVAERGAVLKEIERLIVEFQITTDQLRDIAKMAGRAGVTPRFWNPETGATWAGRGRRPKWLDTQNLDVYRLPGLNDEGD